MVVDKKMFEVNGPKFRRLIAQFSVSSSADSMRSTGDT
jgi:hypothetical protein